MNTGPKLRVFHGLTVESTYIHVSMLIRNLFYSFYLEQFRVFPLKSSKSTRSTLLLSEVRGESDFVSLVSSEPNSPFRAHLFKGRIALFDE